MSSKLQLRAKILELITVLDINSLNKKEQEAMFCELKNIEDQEFLQQILFKELNSEDEVIIEKIAYLISELVDGEDAKKVLWDYIKTPNISDKVKEISCTLLRIFGEKIRPEALMDYLKNPMELIDAETKKLLDVALINPEVQIDFLDFLFALPKDERLNLVKSLEGDYQGDRLVNVVAPILDFSDDIEIKEFIIKILGNSKIYSAIEPLTNVIEYSKDNNLKKLAEIGLKKLKLSGILPSEEKMHASDVLACQKSIPYKSYISLVDGMGNQGIVMSRISEDENVQMFSVVINDLTGIVDCFGFYFLSKNEFERIVETYKKDSVNVQISPEMAKYYLLQAESLNRLQQKSLSYEYLAWKSLFYDIEKIEFDFEQKAKECSASLKNVNYSLLLEGEIFNTWFFDTSDNPYVDKFFNEILVENFVVDESLDDKILKVVAEVFDDKLIEIYQKRLFGMVYFLEFLGEIALRDNVALLALEMQKINSAKECELFTWIIRKSVYELFLREKTSCDADFISEVNIFAKDIPQYKPILTKEKAQNIIEALRASWV